MQRFDVDLPSRLIQLLPEAYRRIFYEEKHEWRDPPAGFFMKGGYLTIPTPDRITPTWVQVPPSSNDPWDQTHTAFERFGTVADLMTPTLTIHRADGQQQGGQMNTTRGNMGVASTALGSSTTPGGGSTSQSAGGQTPPEQEHLEEEAFLEGEVPRVVEAIPQVVEAIQQAVREAIQEDHQVEEARQVEEDRRVAEAHQEAQQEEAPTTRNQPEGTT
ncbi:hypothetical protein WOLCODRAFT_158748 [Wolfiporia cocos MD-104 SS10]|uniref:Uncharacterized protein n=1 Tax=Wolfiporia cocos (strain MD-104) TaxID=742152 RepID=A0A2H3JAH7_WOLCO|nr:hypothetical protein WOLCODRAFT_158748 [Wolfiporia cocos MD-104 SS10]